MLHLVALALEEVAHRFRKPRMREVMHAPRDGRVEAAQPFVFAARARLEARQPALDAMFDARVVAHVEVQELVILETSPIAPVKHARFFEAETSRYDLLSLVREFERDVALEVGAHQLEK